MKASSRLANSMKFLAAVALFIISSIAVNAQEAPPPPPPLESAMTAFLVETNDEGKEVLTKTEQVKPGQLIEYVSRNTNMTDRDLLEVSVVGPIPTSLF